MKIDQIIAAAKRRGGIADREPTFARSALYDHAIAMAEALLRISDMPFADYKAGINVRQFWIDECGQRIRIARDTLAAIVKEANRG